MLGRGGLVPELDSESLPEQGELAGDVQRSLLGPGVGELLLKALGPGEDLQGVTGPAEGVEMASGAARCKVSGPATLNRLSVLTWAARKAPSKGVFFVKYLNPKIILMPAKRAKRLLAGHVKYETRERRTLRLRLATNRGRPFPWEEGGSCSVERGINTDSREETDSRGACTLLYRGAAGNGGL